MKLKIILSVVAIVLIPLGILGLFYMTPLSYFYCCFRETSWLPSSNMEELESRIHVPHSRNIIDPSKSLWGSGHEMKEGQFMVQYLIFGKEPLDVVYYPDHTIEFIYTSYE